MSHAGNMISMRMSPEERAAKKKRDKERQKANKKKAPTIKPAGVVGSPISGSNAWGTVSGAKVKAHKDKLPGNNDLAPVRDGLPPDVEAGSSDSRFLPAGSPTRRNAEFFAGSGDHDAA